jgi:geranylgeranyl diphosphate synthase type II
MDINFEQNRAVAHHEYIEMIRLKTAVLLAASMQIGAVIGGAGDSDAAAIYQYGLNLGIAFQIQDDILDCFGKPEQTGKRQGGDIMQNKKTLLLIEALQRASANSDDRLKNVLNTADTGDKLKNVLHIFEEYKIQEYAESIKNQYIDKSIYALNQINIDKEKKLILNNLIEHLVLRSF